MEPGTPEPAQTHPDAKPPRVRGEPRRLGGGAGSAVKRRDPPRGDVILAVGSRSKRGSEQGDVMRSMGGLYRHRSACGMWRDGWFCFAPSGQDGEESVVFSPIPRF